MQKAAIYFLQAVNKDPEYGAAYSGLADCSSGLTWHGFNSPAKALPKANAAALKAVQINPESAEAHASLALVLHHQLDWHLSAKGRHDEALLEARRALELDPLNLMIGT